MNKIYFNRGDVVSLKQDISGKPARMMVARVEKMKRKDENVERLIGVSCLWFTEDGRLQRHIFDTKDLIHVE